MYLIFNFLLTFLKKYSPTTTTTTSLMFVQTHRKFYILQNVNSLGDEIPRLKNAFSHGLAEINLMPGTLTLLLTDRYERMIETDRELFG